MIWAKVGSIIWDKMKEKMVMISAKFDSMLFCTCKSKSAIRHMNSKGDNLEP